jgi:hypothetical protein
LPAGCCPPFGGLVLVAAVSDTWTLAVACRMHADKVALSWPWPRSRSDYVIAPLFAIWCCFASQNATPSGPQSPEMYLSSVGKAFFLVVYSSPTNYTAGPSKNCRADTSQSARSKPRR